MLYPSSYITLTSRASGTKPVIDIIISTPIIESLVISPVALTNENLTRCIETAPTKRDYCNEEGYKDHRKGSIYVLIDRVLSK